MAALKRSANGGRQLVLLAALLFGIVTMHTLGHPTSHSSSPTPGHSSSHVPSHPSGPEQAAARHEMSSGESAPPEMPEVTGHARVATAVGEGLGMDGMDPLSVCLAVLAALTLVLLLKAGLLRPGGFAVPARALARLLDGLRPNPPPPRILLSHLSVLRI
ncbi:DUF6153 family protein [Streptomyces sp. BA2]|uniref:DUF6153 family protein n=1 Tax=Streptomyces sp. BA2 TaxID=436595 RepID=UPI0013255F99|nr:DUF6153 family protein [Streptomyces sp. BA2]MWA10755.1 hypothetical protein [Streptomyces sp. BA2]